MKINREGHRIIGISGILFLICWLMIFYMFVNHRSTGMFYGFTAFLIIFWLYIITFFRELSEFFLNDKKSFFEIAKISLRFGHKKGDHQFTWDRLFCLKSLQRLFSRIVPQHIQLRLCYPRLLDLWHRITQFRVRLGRNRPDYCHDTVFGYKKFLFRQYAQRVIKPEPLYLGPIVITPYQSLITFAYQFCIPSFSHARQFIYCTDNALDCPRQMLLFSWRLCLFWLGLLWL